jgi:PAS domain S-box-containing protein
MPVVQRGDDYQRLEQRLADLHALVQVITEVNRSLDLDHVLKTSLEGIQRVVGGEFGCFLLIQPITRSLELTHATALPAPLLESLRHLTLDLDAMLTRDYLHSISTLGQRVREIFKVHGFEFFAVIPLTARGQAIGVLVVEMNATKVLAPPSVDLMMAIGEQVGKAIENARLHAAVRESEEWHRAFIENSPDGFWQGDFDGKIMFVNDAACRITGFAREELTGMRTTDLVIPEDKELRAAAREELLRTGFLINRHTRFRTKSGEIKTISFTTRVVRDQQGKINGYQSIFRDVTEQQQLFEELRRRNQELSVLNTIANILSHPLEIDPALDQVCEQIASLTATESVTVYLMDESQQALNLRAWRGLSDNLMNQVQRLGLDDPATRRIAVGRETIALNDVAQYAEPGLASPRAEGYHAGIGVPIQTRGKSIGAIFVGSKTLRQYEQSDVELLVNIGERIGMAVENAQLFQNLLGEQRKVQAIFDSGLSGLYATDMAGRITMFNRAAERMTGWTLREVRGKTWTDLFADSAAGITWQPLIHEALERKRNVYVPTGRTLLTRDGRTIPVAEAVAPLLGDQGAVTGAVGAFWDLTREQEASLNRENFLRMVAHQIRTPLTGLLSALELLQRRHLPAEQHTKMWDVVKSEGARLERFSQQFLELEASAQSAQSVQCKPLRITPVVRKLVRDFRMAHRAYRFRVYAVRPTPLVYADRDRVENVLRNLLDNAVIYSPEGSFVKVSVDTRDAGEQVDIAVKDQGPGIPLRDQTHIFEPFYRVSRLEGQRVYGHGLGLYIARKLAREMEGDIELESQDDRGSTFHLTLRRFQ